MDLYTHSGLKEQSRKVYEYRYKELVKKEINFFDTEDGIINFFENYESINGARNCISVVLLIRRKHNLAVSKIIDFRNSLKADQNYKADVDPKEIINFTRDLYNSKDYKKFIINFLLVNFSCRNADIDVYIDGRPNDGINNFLSIVGDDVLFIRNRYKTVGIYGSKVSKITSIELTNAIKHLQSQGRQTLLTTTNKNSEILNSTYNKIGQGRYNKIFMKNSTPAQIKQISARRGTDISTLFNYYT